VRVIAQSTKGKDSRDCKLVREVKLQRPDHIMWENPYEGVDDNSHCRHDHDKGLQIIAVPGVLERYRPVVFDGYTVQQDANDSC
jgi:hypothetical protein